MNNNFKLLEEKNIEQINSVVQIYEHIKTKAKHVHIVSNDKNFNENGFSINLNTLPENDTGVAHILEHFVLTGGSKKYPIKSGFFKLIDTSLSKYMNAQTANDFTRYLFASDNKKDYLNNMDFYLDSVFNSTMEKETFMQEGWRYSISNENGVEKLKYDGVVYNEMKGVENNEVMVAINQIKKHFYKGTVYENNSGGATESITDLSFEELKNFYNKYYHPSNSVFFTYSHIPAQELQNKIDGFINKYDYLKLDVDEKTYVLQNFKNETNEIEHFVPEETDDHNLYFFFKSFLSSDFKNGLRAKILEQILFHPNSSFIKYIEKNNYTLGPLNGNLNNWNQNAFIFNIMSVDKKHVNETKDAILSAINDFKNQNWSQEYLLSILSDFELTEKEQRAQGKSYSLSILNNLSPYFKYKDKSILECFENKDIFKEIKKEILDNTFVNNICNEIFKNENFHFYLSKPSTQLNIIKKQKEDEKLKNIFNKLSKEDKQKIIIENEKLELLQKAMIPTGVLPEVKKEDVEQEDFSWIISPDYKDKNITIFDYSKPISYIKLKIEIPFIEPTVYNKLVKDCYLNLIDGLASYNKLSLEESIESRSIYAPDFNIKETEEINFNYKSDEAQSYTKKEKYLLKISAKCLSENAQKMFEVMTNSFFNASFKESGDKLNSYLLSKKQQLTSHNKIAEGLANKKLTMYLSKNNFYKSDFANVEHITQYNALLDKAIKDKDFFKQLLIDVEQLHKKYLDINNKNTINITSISPKEVNNEMINKYNDFINNKNNKNNENSLTNYLEKNISIEPKNENIAYLSQVQVNQCFEVRNVENLTIAQQAKLNIASQLFSKYMYKILREENGAYTAESKMIGECLVFLTMRDPNNLTTFDNIKKCSEKMMSDLNDGKISQKDLDQIILKNSSKEYPADTYSLFSLSDKLEKENSFKIIEEMQKQKLSVTLEDIKNVWQEFVINKEPDNKIISANIKDKEKLISAGFIIEDVQKIDNYDKINLKIK